MARAAFNITRKSCLSAECPNLFTLSLDDESPAQVHATQDTSSHGSFSQLWTDRARCGINASRFRSREVATTDRRETWLPPRPTWRSCPEIQNMREPRRREAERPQAQRHDSAERQCHLLPTEDVARRSRPRLILAIVGAAAVAALGVNTDRGRAPYDPLEECVEYAATLRRCFGDKATITAPRPPSDEKERDAARRRCQADRARIERACR